MATRILIVEDEAIIAMLLGDLLADLGHEVCAIAATGAEAIAAAAVHRPDLMIIDVNLRGESGIDAADIIIAREPVRCIFVSGDNVVLATLAARAEVMTKPYHQRDIERAIARALGGERPVAPAPP